MSKIQNPKVEVPATLKMNEKDYLTDILESEKNLSNNFSIALDEMSHQQLFEQIYQIFDEVKKKARNLYDVMFQYGWYALEEAEQKKIQEEHQKLQQELQELSQPK